MDPGSGPLKNWLMSDGHQVVSLEKRDPLSLLLIMLELDLGGNLLDLGLYVFCSKGEGSQGTFPPIV